jgi:hypothetical protein
MPFCPKNSTILAVRPITYVPFVRARLTFCARSAEILSVHEWVIRARLKFRSCTLKISLVHARISVIVNTNFRQC